MKKAALVLVVALSVTACSGSNGEVKLEVNPTPTPTAEEIHDWEELKFAGPNDSYVNVRHQCDGHGHRVYVQEWVDGGEIKFRVINDPTCPGGKENSK